MTKVKVGKVTNLSDARYCAGMGVDFLSFPVSRIDPKTFKEITGWLAGPQFGVELDLDNHEAVDLYNAHFIQIGSNQIDEFQTEIPIMLNLHVDDWPFSKVKLIQLKDRIEFIELTISGIDAALVQVLEEIAKDFKVLVKYSSFIDLDQILKLLIAGISLDGNSEDKPGLKDYPFAEVLEKLEVVD